jgi:hypothetical protein
MEEDPQQPAKYSMHAHPPRSPCSKLQPIDRPEVVSAMQTNRAVRCAKERRYGEAGRSDDLRIEVENRSSNPRRVLISSSQKLP